MNVLVTGGAGYVGSLLVPQLLGNGHRVVVIDNFMYGQTPLLDCIHSPELTVVNEPFNPQVVDLTVFDAVVHLACITGAPACDRDPVLAERTNLVLTYTLLDRLPKTTPLIFPCTNSGYGVGQDTLACDEETPLNPISLYGCLKVRAERHILDWGGVSLRFATLFGISPRMRLDLLVNDFVYRALNDRVLVLFEPHFKRNYLHVQDGAMSLVFALNHYDEMKGGAYNVGLSNANLSKLELANKIKEHLPETTIIHEEVGRDVDKRNYVVSNKKIETLGYRPQYSLDDGIAELIRGYSIIRRNEYSNV